VLASIINVLSENIVAPLVMGKGLSVSPTIVFISFIFWMFILGVLLLGIVDNSALLA
jgi:predicted PurR-regulated permease PerM